MRRERDPSSAATPPPRADRPELEEHPKTKRQRTEDEEDDDQELSVMEAFRAREGGRIFAVVGDGVTVMAHPEDMVDNDVSEIYSPPRVASRAARHGLKGG